MSNKVLINKSTLSSLGDGLRDINTITPMKQVIYYGDYDKEGNYNDTGTVYSAKTLYKFFCKPGVTYTFKSSVRGGRGLLQGYQKCVKGSSSSSGISSIMNFLPSYSTQTKTYSMTPILNSSNYTYCLEVLWENNSAGGLWLEITSNETTSYTLNEWGDILKNKATYYGPQKVDFHNYNNNNYLPTYVFYGHDGIKEIDFTGIDYIPNGCAGACGNLEKITIPSNCAFIGGAAFNACVNLTEVIFADTIATKVIPESMFAYCSKLKTIKIPEGIETIGNNVWYGCTSLEEVELPSTLKKLSSNLFPTLLSDFKLEKLIIKSPVPTTYSDTIANKGLVDLYVMSEQLENYENSAFFSGFKNIIPYDSEDLNAIFINGEISYNIYNGTSKQNTYTIKYNQYNNAYEEQRGVVWSCTGPATIDENGVLTILDTASEGDTVIITATSTYDSTIFDTITVNIVSTAPYMTIDLNSNWRIAETATSPTTDVLYESNSNYHISSGIARTRITLNGIESFTIAIRSYGEGNYDYTWITKPNQAICTKSPGSTVPSYAVANTKGKASATVYTTYTYTGLQNNDYIDIYYTKDGSGDSNADRGYFYIVDSDQYNITVNE